MNRDELIKLCDKEIGLLFPPPFPDQGEGSQHYRRLKIASALKQLLTQGVDGEPYGYVWFDKNMEHRFSRMPPHTGSKDGAIGEVTPVYKAMLQAEGKG